ERGSSVRKQSRGTILANGAPAVNGHVTAPPRTAMNSRRLISRPRGSGRWIVATPTCAQKGGQAKAKNVRFGSKADMAACPHDVRFTPKSGCAVQIGMSAMGQKRTSGRLRPFRE